MNLNRGQSEIRAIKALAMAHGDIAGALAYAEGQAWGSEVPRILMAATSGMTTSTDGAGLVGPMGTDLLSIVRPLTIIGKLQGLRRVPFDIQLGTTTSASGANWVGEGKAAPLTRSTFSRIATTIPRLKVVAIVVVTEELAKSSTPNAESTLSKDFNDACVSAADVAFIDPANSGIANVKPASVTFGAPAFASTGATLAAIDADLGKLMDSLISRGSTLHFASWVLDPMAVSFLCRLRGSGGVLAYPNLTMQGGTLLSLPVIVSGNVPNVGSPQSSSIALIDASRVWLAEDGAMAFDVSRATTLQQLDNPTQDITTPTPTTQTSMFQTNSVACRGTRFLNWQIAEAGAAAVLNLAPY